MTKILGVLVLSCLVLNIYAGSVSFITPCKSDDQKCLITSVQAALPVFVNGLPEYDIPVCEPIHIDSGVSDSPGMNLKYTDLYFHGLSKAKIMNVVRDKTNIKLVAKLPLKINGQYDLTGKLLRMEIQGKGNVNITIGNIEVEVDVKTTTVKGADGKDYWKATGFDYKYDITDKVDMKMDGLFGGDNERAKAFTQLLDNSGKEVIQEAADPIIKQVLTLQVKNVNKFFAKVPCEELEIV